MTPEERFERIEKNLEQARMDTERAMEILRKNPRRAGRKKTMTSEERIRKERWKRIDQSLDRIDKMQKQQAARRAELKQRSDRLIQFLMKQYRLTRAAAGRELEEISRALLRPKLKL